LDSPVQFERNPSKQVRLEGLRGAADVARPVPGVVVVTLTGHDAGEIAAAIFREIEIDLELQAPVQLFVDGSDASAFSLSAAEVWTRALREQAPRLGRILFLMRTRLAVITSEFVRTNAGLQRQMEVVADPRGFRQVLRGSGTFPIRTSQAPGSERHVSTAPPANEAAWDADTPI
jgi:hypothetical protein